MKKIYFIVSLMIFAVCQAQTLNITDAKFKAYLLSASPTNYIAFNANHIPIVIDTNGDQEIQLSEALLVKELTVSGSTSSVASEINSIAGIKSFTNLSKLAVQYISNNNFTSFDVSGMSSLTELVIAGSHVSSFNADNCTNLKKLNIHGGYFQTLTLNIPSLTELSVSEYLTSLNIQGCPNIKILYLDRIMLGTLSLNNISNLQEVTVGSYGYPWLNNTISISGCNDLKKVSFYGPNVQSVTISNNPLLTDITSDYSTSVPTVNITNNASLKNIALVDNEIANLTLTGSPVLETLNVEENSLTNISLTNFPLLKSVKCSENLLTSLNLSANPLINYLDCSDNHLKIINFKNGGQVPYNFNISNNPELQYVCCDAQNTTNVSYYLMIYGYTNVNLNSYCSFTPGGTFYTVNGKTRYDSNSSGCDASDPDKAFQKFLVANGTATAAFSADAIGTHFIPLQAGSHTITPVLENPAYFNVSPASITVNFPAQASPLTQNFCITANGTHNDLEALIIPLTAASPGFDAKYKIIYKNKGTHAQSGTVSFSYNDNLTDYLAATMTPASQSTGLLNWNFSNLLPFETREITVTLKMNTPTQTPALNGGDILYYTAQVNGAADETSSDNTFTLNQTVVNSFDPNDKTCLEGNSIALAKVGDYVHYLVRFENTGTANAQNIVVKDEIDASKFDISSLISLHGSHNFVTRITGNTVEFIFENIQLPFNNATNDGYVSFKIKTKSALTAGDSFSNTAKIYFDYNFPIITNTYTTTVQNILAAAETGKQESNISVYPNPVKDTLYFRSDENIIKAEMYDVSGRIISSVNPSGHSLDVSHLAKGNYLIRFSTKEKSVTRQFIKN
ncbi:T9SS type A sorting domain-containing protein [uncultured Chryseobacterium sp.]|uniref:DUF7619 domain-containing protein n=1 Tax=uncultured Chryseobacterium sp. TaxID=259322 RepID=UPI0025F96BBC|nr:T9SS type A sorting domain-containing protein [uncultured Chryseobacterium sp.]